MKKNILFIGLALTVIVAVLVYRMVYKDHRQIESEKVEFTTTSTAIQQEYFTDLTAADAKYADKTIVVTGKLTSYDVASNTIVVDEKLSALLQNKSDEVPPPGSPIQIKGRLVGYDDLLEELKMDQASLLNSN